MMNKQEKERLEKDGWKVGNAEDFVKDVLTDPEVVALHKKIVSGNADANDNIQDVVTLTSRQAIEQTIASIRNKRRAILVVVADPDDIAKGHISVSQNFCDKHMPELLARVAFDSGQRAMEAEKKDNGK